MRDLGPNTMSTDNAVCITCRVDINTTDQCGPNHAYTYGDEPFWTVLQRTPSDQCRSCGVRLHEPHHLPGCVVARCRVCNEQATFCGHWQ